MVENLYKRCMICGKNNSPDSKFCVKCGNRLINSESETDDRYYERKQEYAGKIIKCPACGEEIPSLTAICPACGHEINFSKISESVERFIFLIRECDRRIIQSPIAPRKGWSTWGSWKKLGWILLNLYFMGIPLLIYVLYSFLKINKKFVLTAEEKYKATIIENYQFPNDRGSILEALLYVEAKIDFLSSEKLNVNTTYWMRLWTKKAEQLYEKVEMFFPGDKIAERAYQEILKDNITVNKKVKIRLAVVIGIVIFFILYSGFPGGKENPDKSNNIKDEWVATEQMEEEMKYEWPVSELTDVIPKPESEYGKVSYETEKMISVEINKITTEMFEKYVKACREEGFVKGLTKTDTSYLANNEEGYKLNITYDNHKEQMKISIDSYDVEKKEPEKDNYKSMNVKNFTFDMPNYWEEEGSRMDYLQYYAEKGETCVMLSVAYPEETDPNYEVSFKGLYDDNENMINVIASMYTKGDVIDDKVFETDYGIKGMLYHFSCQQKLGLFGNLDANGYCFCFPSEKDRRWFYIYYVQTNNIEGNDYKDDYMKMIASIREKEQEQ